MSLRFRIPDDLADRLRLRASRAGVASSVAMALQLLAEHVDDDLPADWRPDRPVLQLRDGAR